MSLTKDLISLANHLDKKGFVKEADFLDAILRKMAQAEDLVIQDLSYLGLTQEEVDVGPYDPGYDQRFGKPPPTMRMVPVLRVSFSVSGLSKTMEFNCYTYAMRTSEFMQSLEMELCSLISIELARSKVMDYKSAHNLCESKVKNLLNMEMVEEMFAKIKADMMSQNVSR